jgi:hypothetical protein
MTYSDVFIQPLDNNKYILAIEIKYKNITVPKGFITNGADIPRLLWSFIPPNKSDLMPAVIVHDYLCYIEQYTMADKYFEEILLSMGVGKITTKNLQVPKQKRITT